MEEHGSSDDDDRYFQTANRKRISPSNKRMQPASAKNEKRSGEGIANANMGTPRDEGYANGVGAEVEGDFVRSPPGSTIVVVSAVVESVARSIAAAHLQ